MSEKDQSPLITGTHRLVENGHILLWLIKDTCWALEWKLLGITMIVPTVSVAFYLLWRARHLRSETFHNLAVCIWIVANSIWMIGEFNDADMRPVSASMFIAGLLVLAVYYIFFFRKEVRTQRAANGEAAAAGQRQAVLTVADELEPHN